MSTPTIHLLWHSPNEQVWETALDRYWDFIKDENLPLEKSLNSLKLEDVAKLDEEGWFTFLHCKYFPWKYTAPNRLKTTRSTLIRSAVEPDGLAKLYRIKEQLFDLDFDNVKECLEIVHQIPGLGVAGASGLLALMYPERFGTVDQFVVKALCGVADLPELNQVRAMNPLGLKAKEGAILNGIMARQASRLNELFGLEESWTPRKIDMVLWTYGREKCEEN